MGGFWGAGGQPSLGELAGSLPCSPQLPRPVKGDCWRVRQALVLSLQALSLCSDPALHSECLPWLAGTSLYFWSPVIPSPPVLGWEKWGCPDGYPEAGAFLGLSTGLYSLQQQHSPKQTPRHTAGACHSLGEQSRSSLKFPPIPERGGCRARWEGCSLKQEDVLSKPWEVTAARCVPTRRLRSPA